MRSSSLKLLIIKVKKGDKMRISRFLAPDCNDSRVIVDALSSSFVMRSSTTAIDA